MEAFVTGVLAGYGIAIPVGAIAILIVEVGIRCGFRCAFAAGSGAASADLFYAGLAVAGGAGLATAVSTVQELLRIASAIVLIAIAVVGLWRARRRTPEAQPADFDFPGRRELASTYARFLGLTIINPATVVYFAAFVIGLGMADDMTAAEGALFVLGAFAASLSWQSLLAGVGAFAGHRLPQGAQTAAVVFGNLLILTLAVFILVR